MRNSAVSWVLDFGYQSVMVLAAQEKKSGEWVVLGKGEARAEGFERNEIKKMTDVVESIVEAIKKAEQSSGNSCHEFYYTVDDCQMNSIKPRGAKILAGEGQIRREDVKEATRNALRSISDFEKKAVYSRQISYVIDDKDLVGNPVGVFGHRLDVVLHVLLARSLYLDEWKKMTKRAGFDRAYPVVSFVSAFHAVLDKNEPAKIVWDLGKDVCSGGVVDKHCLRDYAVFLNDSGPVQSLAKKVEEISRDWAREHSIEEPWVVTGDLAEKVENELEFAAVGTPKNFSFLEQPQYASLLGLLRIASEAQKAGAGAQTNQHLIRRVKEKANSILQEYF